MRNDDHSRVLPIPVEPAVAGKTETSVIFAPGQSVVLVGNGPSALLGTRGAQIDRFDVVVRFNRFVLASYGEQVGTRTDAWCRNEGPHGGTRETAIESGASAVLLASNHARQKLHQRILAELSGAFPRCEVVSQDVWDQVRGAMGGAEPSSGMLAIAHAIQFVSRVYTVGFDCMSAGRHHYFEPGEETAHSSEVETRYFRSLLRSGAVVELPDGQT